MAAVGCWEKAGLRGRPPLQRNGWPGDVRPGAEGDDEWRD